jgi:hypothetical protein
MSKEKQLKRIKLPNKLIALPNADKKFHEKWYDRRNPLNIPHPWRGVFVGSPGVGKTTTVKNILLRAYPAFEQLFVIHCCPDGTNEYDDVGGVFLKDFPSPESWDGNKKKTLVIIDDVELKSLNKIQMKNLNRLYGYTSTHCNVSVALCSQDSFQVPSIVRRCANIFVLWKPRDLDSLATTARKSGIQSREMRAIFDQLMKNPKDSMWIDLTDKSPYGLRKNGFEMITKTEESDDTKKFVDSFDKFEVD